MFKNVIVTMPITKKYLLQKQFCTEEQIEYIYGGIVQNNNYKQKLLYKKDKNTFDICFIAHKYSELGKDKGYDTVIEVAKKMISKYKDVHFHIVGPWENVIDIGNINKEQIHFYGIQPKDFFVDFYSKMDIYLSPNRYQILQKGNFDGYPLGIEAAYAGVYIMGTDPLSMKDFTPLSGSKGFEVIDNNSDEIIQKIINKIDNLDSFYKDSIEQQTCALQIFNFEKQMEARINIINKYLKNNTININSNIENLKTGLVETENNLSI
jgi:glycosyltransferase involved in cell wall biosynthesis